MNREAGWIAVILAGLLLLLAMMSPRQPAGGLPTLEAIEERPAQTCQVPVVGSVVCGVHRMFSTVTWQLEMIPVE
jgi:hypothetical protein